MWKDEWKERSKDREVNKVIDRGNVPMADMPSGDHRYFVFPYLSVFDGAMHVLRENGYRIKYSNIYIGRIIAFPGRGRRAQSQMDIRIIGRGRVSFMHVDIPNSSMTRTDLPGEVKRWFFWELDDWLHSACPNELMEVHKDATAFYGSPDVAYVPRSSVYDHW